MTADDILAYGASRVVIATGGFEFDDMPLTSYHNSLYTMIANNSIHTNPPLCITDDQLAQALAQGVDRCVVHVRVLRGGVATT